MDLILKFQKALSKSEKLLTPTRQIPAERSLHYNERASWKVNKNDSNGALKFHPKNL